MMSEIAVTGQETPQEVWTLAKLLPLDEGLQALTTWKATRDALWWLHVDQCSQAITSEAIRVWPEGDLSGLIAVIEMCKTVLRETAAEMGIPSDALPFVPIDGHAALLTPTADPGAER